MKKDVIKDIKKDIKKKKKKKDIKKKLKIFEKNKWGFTLVELLAVIVIIGLVIGGSIFGIIKLINSSKGEASIISESSIKKTASIYSTEKNDDDDYWTEMTREGYEGKYFCVTIEELINKGLLPKDKDLGDVDIHTYVGIRKDNVTFVNGNPILLKDIPSSDGNVSLTEEQIIYGVCTGNIINETITKHPVLSGGTSYTDEVTNISFTDIEGENIKIKESICSYGLTSGNLDRNGTISSNTCSLDNLKDNTPYYVRVCTSTEGGSVACSDTISKSTKDIVEPSFNLSDKLKITYNNTGIKGDSYYYFKSSMNATINVNVSSCTLNNDNTFNCNNDNTTNISSNNWYKTTNKDIELTYNTSGKVNIVARTYDKSNNYAEGKKDFNVYKVIFNRGTADKIGDGTSDITKICLAETSGTCSIKSPTIEKTGYNVVGWNTNANATTSSWNANTNKNNVSGTYYPITKAKTIKVTFYRNTSTSDSTTATQTFTYGVSGQKFSAKGWTNTGHTLAGWARRKSATTKNYDILSGVNDTWINKYAPSIDLYAVWNKDTYTITYDANGGTGAPGSQSKVYGTKITLSSVKPTRTGYTFKEWNTKSDGKGTSYAAGGTFSANSNTTLYAIWSAKTVKVTFYRNTTSSDATTTTQTFTYGKSGQSFSAKGWTKTGYTLEGWATSKSATKANYNILNGVSNDWINNNSPSVSLYAVWSPKKIVAIFHRNTSSSDTTKATETFTYDNVTGKTFSDKKWTNTGHTLAGWSETATGTAKYNVLNRITNTWIDNNAPEINLYAVWKRSFYTITYDANGGTGAPASQTKKPGVNINLSGTKPTRKGYVFANWNTSPLGYGYGTWYIPNETYADDEDLTLYAQWDPEIFTLASVTAPTYIDYGTETNFDTYTSFSTNYLNTNSFVLEAYSEDCALKSSQGRRRNCVNGKWVTYDNIYINAYYYTNNDNVYTADENTNDGEHCIYFRGRIGTVYTDNVLSSCYYVTR